MNLIQYINTLYNVNLTEDSIDSDSLKAILDEDKLKQLVTREYLNQIDNYVELRQNTKVYNAFLSVYPIIDVYWAHLRQAYSNNSEFYLALFENGWQQDLLDWGFFDNGLDNLEIFENAKLKPYLLKFLDQHKEIFNNNFLRDNLGALNHLGLLDSFLEKNWADLDQEDIQSMVYSRPKAFLSRINQLTDAQILKLAQNNRFGYDQRTREHNNAEIKSLLIERWDDVLSLLSGDTERYEFIQKLTSFFQDTNGISSDRIYKILDKLDIEFVRNEAGSKKTRNEIDYLKTYVRGHTRRQNQLAASAMQAEARNKEEKAQEKLLKDIKEFRFESLKYDFHKIHEINLNEEETYALFEYAATGTKSDYWLHSKLDKKLSPQKVYDRIKGKATKEFLEDFVNEFGDKLKIDFSEKFDKVGLQNDTYSTKELKSLYKDGKFTQSQMVAALNPSEFRPLLNVSTLTDEDWSHLIQKESVLNEEIALISLAVIKKNNKKSGGWGSNFAEMLIYKHPKTTTAERIKLLNSGGRYNSISHFIAAAQTAEEIQAVYEKYDEMPLRDSKNTLVALLKRKDLLTEEQYNSIIAKIFKAKDAAQILAPFLNDLDPKLKAKMFTASLKDVHSILSMLEGKLNLKEKERAINALFKFEKELEAFIKKIDPADTETLTLVFNRIVDLEDQKFIRQYFIYFAGKQRNKLLSLFDPEVHGWRVADTAALTAEDVIFLTKKLDISFIFDKLTVPDTTIEEIKAEKTKLGLYAALSSKQNKKIDWDFYLNEVEIDEEIYEKAKYRKDKVFTDHLIRKTDKIDLTDLEIEQVCAHIDALIETDRIKSLNHKGLLYRIGYTTEHAKEIKKYLKCMIENHAELLTVEEDPETLNKILIRYKLEALKDKLNLKIINSASELRKYTLLKYFKDGLSLDDLTQEVASEYLAFMRDEDELKDTFEAFPGLTTDFVLKAGRSMSINVFEVIQEELILRGETDLIHDIAFKYLEERYYGKDGSDRIYTNFSHLFTKEQNAKLLDLVLKFIETHEVSEFQQYFPRKWYPLLKKVPASMINVGLFHYSGRGEGIRETLLSGEISEDLLERYKEYILMDKAIIEIENPALLSRTIDFILDNKEDIIDFKSEEDKIVAAIRRGYYSSVEIASLDSSSGEITFAMDVVAKHQGEISSQLETLFRLPEEVLGYYNLESQKFEPDGKLPKKYYKNILTNFKDQDENILNNLSSSRTVEKLKAKLIKNVDTKPNSRDSSSEEVYYELKLNFKDIFKPQISEELTELLTLKNKSANFTKTVDQLPLTNRRWGFELEFSSSQPKMKLGNLLEKDGWSNIQVTNSYVSSKGDNWDLKQDGSVRSVDGGFTIELASPILIGEDGLNDAQEFLDFLFTNSKVSVGDVTNSGLHIHHEVKDLMEMNSNLKEYGAQLVKTQEALYSLCSDYRQNNDYCARLDRSSLDNSGLGLDDRKGFNFTSKGTLEFRMRESINETAPIIRWIKLTQKMVEDLVLVANKQIKEYNEASLGTLELIKNEKMLQNPDEKALSDYLIAERISKILISEKV